MYNYNFNSENIIYEKHNCFAEVNGKELFVNVLLTQNNLLLFYNTENDIATLKSKGVFVTPNYELLVKLELNNINYECENNNTYINNDEIILYDLSLKTDI